MWISDKIGWSRAWIGVTDQNSEGVWINSYGQEHTFANWHSGEPDNADNEDCALLNSHGGAEWGDLDCASKQPCFICQKSLNECAIGYPVHKCDEHATCTNTDAFYECACNDGYSGSGYLAVYPGSEEFGQIIGGPYTPLDTPACIDIDECTSGVHNCHVHATCINTDGHFVCECSSGYEGDGISCAGNIFGPEINPWLSLGMGVLIFTTKEPPYVEITFARKPQLRMAVIVWFSNSFHPMCKSYFPHTVQFKIPTYLIV